MVLWYCFCVIFLVFGAACSTLQQQRADNQLIAKVVTWNVADNDRMDGSFTDAAIDDVLGLSKSNTEIPSLFAIGLQENCYKCDKDKMAKLSQRFLYRINRNMNDKYSVIGTQGTRMSGWCEWGCKFGTHGSSILIVIGKHELGATSDVFSYTEDCSSKLIPNKEKGMAAVKVELLDGRSVCFANAHLDSKKSSYRRQCVKGMILQVNSMLGLYHIIYHIIMGIVEVDAI